MGFFDSLKSRFDKGGIRVELVVPKEFEWGDETIPVTVTLTGHESEPRRVELLRFTVEDELESEMADALDASESPYGRRVRLAWERDGAIDLAPAQTVAVDVPLPLMVQSALENERLGRASDASGLLGLTTRPGDIGSYRITVETPVDGAARTPSRTRRIRQGGAFHTSIGVCLST